MREVGMGLRESLKVRKREPVAIPGWDGAAYVRRLTGAERLGLAEWQEGQPDTARTNLTLGVKLAVLCLVDADGGQLFQPEDEGWLLDTDPEWISVVVEAASRLNKIGEHAEKNSVPPGGSPAASP